MEQIGTSLNEAGNAFRDAMDHLKDGTRKGSTIIGRFDTIKRLEAKTNKSIPAKYLNELELPGDEEENDSADKVVIDDNEKLL
jgi:DNA recombination protein RmuC